MRNHRRHLPPLDYLIAFEAAARHGGFTAAAGRLNVSQAAVSRKIKLLEENLGQPLFTRCHRSIELTAAGRRYLPVVARALDSLASASREIREPRTRPRIEVAATHSVAALWLMPRLPAARRAHPNLDIRLIASDSDAECLGDSVDLAILRGDGVWPERQAELLLDEEVFAVCTPAYARDAAALDAPRDLPNHRLIEVSNSHDEWLDWRGWLARVDVSLAAAPERLTVNTYPLAIQAACEGLGVALGWRHLVDRHLASGALVRALPQSVRTDAGYYLLTPTRRETSPGVAVFRDWLANSV